MTIKYGHSLYVVAYFRAGESLSSMSNLSNLQCYSKHNKYSHRKYFSTLKLPDCVCMYYNKNNLCKLSVMLKKTLLFLGINQGNFIHIIQYTYQNPNIIYHSLCYEGNLPQFLEIYSVSPLCIIRECRRCQTDSDLWSSRQVSPEYCL